MAGAGGMAVEPTKCPPKPPNKKRPMNPNHQKIKNTIN